MTDEDAEMTAAELVTAVLDTLAGQYHSMDERVAGTEAHPARASDSMDWKGALIAIGITNVQAVYTGEITISPAGSEAAKLLPEIRDRIKGRGWSTKVRIVRDKLTCDLTPQR